MTTIQIDKELSNRLTSGEQTVVVCDEAGNRIGVFVRDETEEELYRRAQAMFSDEELERARREPGRYTLQEILNELQRQ